MEQYTLPIMRYTNEIWDILYPEASKDEWSWMNNVHSSADAAIIQMQMARQSAHYPKKLGKVQFVVIDQEFFQWIGMTIHEWGQLSLGKKAKDMQKYFHQLTEPDMQRLLEKNHMDQDHRMYVYRFRTENMLPNLRIGRTARAGADGTAVSFCAPEEQEYLAGIEKLNRRKIPVVSGHPWDGVPAPVRPEPPVRGRKPKAAQQAPEKPEQPEKRHNMTEENYTYILECADGTLYCGWTNHLQERVAAHNAGKGARYTKSRRPVVLKYYETFSTKQEAMRREWAVKQLSRKEKLELIEAFTQQMRTS